MKQNGDLKSVLIYCRESRDDGFLNYERIETQRDILVAYCREKKLGRITGVIMDDNRSGTDFQRLEPVKERIRNNEIDILLMKDASRLGRNILESLNFTAFLEKYGVELAFESERYDEDIFPLVAWFNERRAKDDSIKIRRVLRHKMEEGEMVIKAPYGYLKKGNQLAVDDKTAPVVREIFGLYLKGCGKSEIASVMNNKGYHTPSQLKKQYENTNRAHIWNKQHIDRILRHVIYTGDMPYGMRRKVSFKSKKFLRTNREDWIIIPNHHEAIISKEDFEEAQERMEKNKSGNVRNPSRNLFSGLLFCGGCGSRMYRKTQKGKEPWYSCSKYEREGKMKGEKPDRGCCSHRVSEQALLVIVKDYIQRLFFTPGLESHIKQALEEQVSNEAELTKEIQAANERMEALRSKASAVYDDKLEGRLPEYLFNEKLAEISTELDRLAYDLESMEQSLRQAREYAAGGDMLNNAVKRIQEKGINNRTVGLMFDRIIVYNGGDMGPEVGERYCIEHDDYRDLCKNGGVMFVQRFMRYKPLGAYE